MDFEALVRGHEVHLWYVLPGQIAAPDLLASYRALLTPDEWARNQRFVFARGRHEHLVTRALVRTILSAYQPMVDPRAWQFVANPYGRPEIAGPLPRPPLRFNLSHTDGLIVCLLAADREIGVDVEDTTRQTIGGIGIADRYFSPAEVAALRAVPPAAQQGRFYDYWTLKESYIKARGLGLQVPLDQFSFHLGPPSATPAQEGSDQPITISFGPGIKDDPATWQFALQRLADRHRLAIAIRRQPGEPDLAVRIRPSTPLIEPRLLTT
jgi:4'-phosphopantetheinyl transferase